MAFVSWASRPWLASDEKAMGETPMIHEDTGEKFQVYILCSGAGIMS
jgi:hypothetical protein